MWAGRATVDSARGGKHQGGRLYVASQQYSKRDLPAHLKMKERLPGQGTREEIQARDLRAELLSRDTHLSGVVCDCAGPAAVVEPPVAKRIKVEVVEEREENVDRDDVLKLEGDEEVDPQEDQEEDEEEEGNEEEELMAELEKIRREREEEKKRREVEVKREESQRAVSSNPLMPVDGSGGSVVKRKWYDETVFRNQAKTEPTQSGKRFVNDTLRNDFHVRFLRKYVK